MASALWCISIGHRGSTSAYPMYAFATRQIPVTENSSTSLNNAKSEVDT
jgi:glycerophosphoryl diester phosphodiesterase